MTTFDRCDLRTMGECSCGPNECRVQQPLNLGTFNKPRPVIDILEEGNTTLAKHGSACLIGLAFITFIIIFGWAVQVAPVAV